MIDELIALRLTRDKAPTVWGAMVAQAESDRLTRDAYRERYADAFFDARIQLCRSAAAKCRAELELDRKRPLTNFERLAIERTATAVELVGREARREEADGYYRAAFDSARMTADELKEGRTWPKE